MVKISGTGKTKVLFMSVVIAYLITVFLLLVLAFIVLKKGTYGMIVSAFITAIYLLAPFAGGFYAGRKTGQKKFVWGLVVAVLYFVIYLTVGFVMGSAADKEVFDYIKEFLLIIVGGMLGGMLS